MWKVVYYGEANRAVDLYLEAGAQEAGAQGRGDQYLLEEV